MFLNYWVDKYMLLRECKVGCFDSLLPRCLATLWLIRDSLLTSCTQYAPKVDDKIVETTRMHLAWILVIHCVVTLHYFAGWPFDQVVEDSRVAHACFYFYPRLQRLILMSTTTQHV